MSSRSTVDLLFVNGTMWTGTSRHPFTNALAVHNGIIVALGEAACSSRSETVVDLDGGFLMPAFGDAHAHPIFAGLERQGPQVADARSVNEITEAVRTYAQSNPKKPWILGASYDPTLAPDGAFDAKWLDRAVHDRPVALRSSDYHTIWCNTEALARAGITADTPDPRIGWILRRDDGSPLGTLREWHACDLVLNVATPAKLADLTLAIRDAAKTYAASGVTWVQDAWVDPGTGMTEAYLEFAGQASPSIRVALTLRADPDTWRDQGQIFRDERAKVNTGGVADLVTAHTVKFFADGVIESGTASLLDPYCDAPHSHGMAVWEPSELAEAVAAFDREGFQAHIHAIGDAGIRVGLDAIQCAVSRNPTWDRRPTIAHVQLVHPADLKRFVQLGVVANFEPLWAQLDVTQTHLTVPRLGVERSGLQYPIRTMVDMDIPISFGSDWPVSSQYPLEGIQTAVTRQTAAGEPLHGWRPEQRLDLTQALSAYTAGSAYQAFADSSRGTLSLGKAADLVHLSENPFEIAPADLGRIQVLGTWLAGHATYCASSP